MLGPSLLGPPGWPGPRVRALGGLKGLAGPVVFFLGEKTQLPSVLGSNGWARVQGESPGLVALIALVSGY